MAERTQRAYCVDLAIRAGVSADEVVNVAKQIEDHIYGATEVAAHKCEDYHDGETINKVYKALMSETGGFSRERASEVIETLLNAGILFREHRPD